MTQAIDGSWNITVVAGSAITGLMAPNGSTNVFPATGASYVGRTHPCGAWYVTRASAPAVGGTPSTAPDGSLYVTTTPFTNQGRPVTVVSGVLP